MYVPKRQASIAGADGEDDRAHGPIWINLLGRAGPLSTHRSTVATDEIDMMSMGSGVASSGAFIFQKRRKKEKESCIHRLKTLGRNMLFF